MVYWWIAAAVITAFGMGALVGAPWLPTFRRETETALDLLDLKPGDTVVDLGSGTGTFLLVAARRGIYGVGYEINPFLHLWSLARTWPQRRYIRLHWRNYWRVELPPADGMYAFLIKRFMGKLDAKLGRELPPGTPVATYTFQIPGRRPEHQKDGVFLYRY
jgi:SAM-dependent methyltransferase